MYVCMCVCVCYISAFFTAAILTCNGRIRTGAADTVNNGSDSFKCDCKPCQSASIHGVHPLLVILITQSHVKISAVKRSVCLVHNFMFLPACTVLYKLHFPWFTVSVQYFLLGKTLHYKRLCYILIHQLPLGFVYY